jgi:peptide/nickel transport system permease protein
VLNFLVKRFIGAIFLVVFITFFTFSIMKLNFKIPELKIQLINPITQKVFFDFRTTEKLIQTGDPLADLKLNPAISEERIQAEARRLGLDKRFWEQYLIWFSNIVQGEFGLSQNNQKVVDLIKPALINTLILNLVSIFFTWLIAIPLGVLAGINQNKFIDNFLRIFTSCFMSMPAFVIAVFVLMFALTTGLFPVGGLTSSYFDELDSVSKVLDLSRHLVLPVFVLTITGLVGIQRQMRANFLDVLQEDYIQTARAKGLPDNKVYFKHALRNAINPLVTIFGYEFSSLFAGSALVETVMGYPGLGMLTLEAARKLDVNLVLANLMIGSVMLVLGNILADILLLKLDPRISKNQLV